MAIIKGVMTDKEEIKILETKLRYYAEAHHIYFKGVLEVKKRVYNRVIKQLAKGVVNNPYEKGAISNANYDLYNNIMDCYFNVDEQNTKVCELAKKFQDYLSYNFAHGFFRKSYKNQTLEKAKEIIKELRHE